MDNLPNGALKWLAVALLLFGVAAITKTFSVGTEIDLTCDGGVWEITPSPADHIMAGCVGGGSEPTATPSPTRTPSETPAPPQAGTNLLVNGDFAGGFDGWQFVNGYWTVHRPIACEPTGTSYAQMDRDKAGLDDWPIGGEDWLWQDVAVSESHSTVIFRMIEAHHMHEGVAEVTVYGQVDRNEPWEMVFHRPGVESPFGTGKCNFVGPPAAFEYVIQVEETFTAYRLEIHGRMVDPEDAFLFGGLELSVE